MAVSAGAFHCLALLSNGTVYSWGGNQHGQLGDNTTTDRHTPVQVKGVKNVGMLSNVVAVSANTDSSAALMSNGTVVAWGANGWGELGDGTTTQSSTPVAALNLTGVSAVSMGTHYCHAAV